MKYKEKSNSQPIKKIKRSLIVRFFRGVPGAIVVLHSSLSSFVVSTRLIRSEVGAIDSPDQFRQGFEKYNTSEVLEKVFHSSF